jgi:predicted GIY-YIG superfamily endonuclease
MYYVYVLKNNSDKFYIGYTTNLERRNSEHQRNKDRAYSLIYYEAYSYEKYARNRERKLKYHGSAWRALRKRISA